MGQPTNGIAQRTGKTQLWQFVPAVGRQERNFGEHQFKLALGIKLLLLFFQSLIYNHTINLWAPTEPAGRLLLHKNNQWGAGVHVFPNYADTGVSGRYFEEASARFLLHDGEHTFYTIPYKHRRLRFIGMLWAAPRLLRIHAVPVLLVRGYNVTETYRPLIRSRSISTQRAMPYLERRKSLCMGLSTAWV